MRRLAKPGDEPAIEAFLATRADSSMFLRSNLRTRGLVDEGQVQQGTYALELDGDRVVAVGAFFWNGMILCQADDPGPLATLVREALPARKLSGLGGPWTQIVTARTALGLDERATSIARPELLYGVDTEALVVPSGGGVCRAPRPEERELLVRWRADFSIEGLGAVDGPELLASSGREIDTLAARGTAFVLEDRGAPVAFSAFNAMLPDVVQIGGVWTPPEHRGRGYARSVVAQSIRGWGGPRAILFTQNPVAIRAYEAIGFREVGSYGLILFA